MTNSNIASFLEIPAGVWTIDPSHSEVGFVVKHAGISKVKGSFTDFNSTVKINEDKVVDSIDAVVKIASVSTGSPDRDAHLKGSDFFDSERFENMTFVSAGIVSSGESLKLHGDLTIKETTLPVELDVEYGGSAIDPFGNLRIGLEATTTISRKDFGLTWNALLETGGVLVSDKVKIILDLSFIKS